MSTVEPSTIPTDLRSREPRDRDTLPADAENPEPGPRRCEACGLPVTVSSSGVEYGHAPARYEACGDDPCPRRKRLARSPTHGGGPR